MQAIRSMISRDGSSDNVAKWCLFWFAANLTITFYNKHVLSTLQISPLVNTFSHLGLTWLGSLLVNQFAFPRLAWRERLRLFAYAFLFSFNIIYSQLGMKLTSLSLNQVTRAATPLFQVGLEYLLADRRHAIRTLLPLAPVIVGVALTTKGDLQVDAWGLAVCVSSVFVSALKGVMSMKILQGELRQRLQEFSFLAVVAPCALFWVLAFEWAMRSTQEGGLLWYLTPWPMVSLFADTTNKGVVLGELPLGYLVVGGCLAFATNTASFGTVKRTSASAMGVMANVKQAVIIFSAMFFAEQDWTMLKLMGVMVTLSGAAWYSYEKDQIRKKQQQAARANAQSNPNTGGSANDKKRSSDDHSANVMESDPSRQRLLTNGAATGSGDESQHSLLSMPESNPSKGPIVGQVTPSGMQSRASTRYLKSG